MVHFSSPALCRVNPPKQRWEFKLKRDADFYVSYDSHNAWEMVANWYPLETISHMPCFRRYPQVVVAQKAEWEDLARENQFVGKGRA